MGGTLKRIPNSFGTVFGKMRFKTSERQKSDEYLSDLSH